MPIVVRRGISVGATSAEDDERFLNDCFVETGQAEQVLDMASPRCIALGRTGSGKSALLYHVRSSEEHSANLDPEDLSLNYISNSDILRLFNDLDIDLELFYELLWRHVLVIELLKLKKEFHDQASAKRWYAAIYNSLNNNPRRRAALEYLERFGNSFWLDTEKRVREVVDKIEGELEKSIGASVSELRAKIGANISKKDAKSHQETTDIIYRANKVVSDVQIQELNELMTFLAEDIFKDRKASYYLLIDDLDRGWVHDSLRFKLTRALIETVKKFRRIRNVKIIIGLRADLLHTVMANTEGRGFQKEKFEDLMLRIRWSKEDLRTLIEKRLNMVFKDQYTKRELVFDDVFSSKIGDVDPLSYMLQRSLMRPRDLISFVNQCFEETEPGATSITGRVIRRAEGEYSNKRFSALADEWREAYGDLEAVLEGLGKLNVRFKLIDLDEEFFSDLVIRVVGSGTLYSGRFLTIANGILSNVDPDYSHIRRVFLEVMYVVGAIGLKRGPGTPIEWSYKNEPVLNFSAIGPETVFAIHPMLHRKLNKNADGASFNT